MLELAQRNGFQVVSSAQALASANPDQRLLGLFSENTMPVRLRGEGGREAEAADPSWLHHLHPYLGRGEATSADDLRTQPRSCRRTQPAANDRCRPATPGTQ